MLTREPELVEALTSLAVLALLPVVLDRVKLNIARCTKYMCRAGGE
jgi:hypothetical protein